jgi:surface polysaccharide O-acyltransferase-like enzyme
MNITERNKCLNLLKGIGCLGVIFIHVRFPGIFGQIIHQLSQYAVPLFFMISVFFAFAASEATLKRRLKK